MSDDSASAVEIARLQRGDLLRVRENVVVTLGSVRVADGVYFFVEDDEANTLPPDTLAVFISVTPDDDSAIVVLVGGQVGWVFTDEVVRA
jgi:hypothetical protein